MCNSFFFATMLEPSSINAMCYHKSFGLLLGRSEATWTTRQAHSVSDTL